MNSMLIKRKVKGYMNPVMIFDFFHNMLKDYYYIAGLYAHTCFSPYHTHNNRTRWSVQEGHCERARQVSGNRILGCLNILSYHR
jgi:hypothetical protein